MISIGFKVRKTIYVGNLNILDYKTHDWFSGFVIKRSKFKVKRLHGAFSSSSIRLYCIDVASKLSWG